MPQPIRKPCEIELVGLVQRQEHAAALGTIIGISGRLESALGWLLAFFSGGSASITIPMFHAVTSTDAQKAMLEAAAEKVLKGSELGQFRALMEEFRPRYRERSKLVHNLWGHSKDHPDKAIWCPASEAAAFMGLVASAQTREELPFLGESQLSLQCMTYTVKDLHDVGLRLETYTGQVNAFLGDLMNNHPVLAALANSAPTPSREGELPLESQQSPQSGQTGQK